MSRDWKLYWAEIIIFCERIERYTAGMEKAQFFSDQLKQDAVLRNLELIGEAAKNLPIEALALAPSVEWRDIKGMRNLIAHMYFGLDSDILWDAITHDVPELSSVMRTVKLP